MKKVFFAVAIMAAMCLTACKSGPEAKAAEFGEKVVETLKTNPLGALAIASEIQEYENTLSADEKKAFEEAFAAWEKEHKAEIEAATKEGEKAMGDMFK